MQTLLDILNGWVLAFILAGLVIGSSGLRQFPLVGSWMRWTLGGYVTLMVLEVVVVLAGIERTPTYAAYRLVLQRLLTAWGIWYCLLYQAYYAQAPPPPVPSPPPPEEGPHG